ncbi:ABC transporter substrate binding protein [Clostridium aestuarii]|uniref:ABC transporter substrate binding protein n=1 Tax=Clostridium aestuarii TaxID=338193 RepID=A0ABT4CY93_9CLOT|nr:ABC transporter substrate binding protein [Clostridium aestuarii]MCY6483080.1 ABC transporter substrate binding protein [Clostridium aestuarii]
MKKTLKINNICYIFFLIFLLLIFNKSICLAQTKQKKQVLILNSYHKGFKWSDDVIIGIQTTLNKSKQNPNIIMEYMDTKRYYSENYFKQLYNLYKFKYKNKKFDVIIATDNNAVRFLLKYSEQLFPNVPVVFCGVNNIDTSLLNEKNIFKGTMEDIVIKDTINSALKNNSNLKQVNVLIDNTDSSIIYKKSIEKLIPYYKEKLSFKFIQISNIEQAVKNTSTLPKDNIVFLTPIFIENSDNNFASFNGIKYICNNCPVPVYSSWSSYLSCGIVGGKILHQYFYGSSTAKIALQILNGENVSNIPITKEYDSKYIFDYTQLKKLNIGINNLPKNSKVINLPSKSYSIPKNLFMKILFTVICIELIIIVILFFNIHKRRKAEFKIIENKKLIEELRKQEALIKKLAFEDPLTNIPNRRSGKEKLHIAIQKAVNKNINPGVMFIDMDKFKFINDTMGHDVGDILLIKFCQRLKSNIRTKDIVARLGGDEFMIILDDVTSYVEVEICANRIIQAIKHPFIINEKKFNITCSIGISIYPEHGTDIETLLKNADIAMYKAKNNGRNNFQLFEEAQIEIV